MLTKVSTDKAPAAIGPYSQGIIAGDFLFASGQIPIDPADGEIKGGDITEQAEQVMKNVGAILTEARPPPRPRTHEPCKSCEDSALSG